MTYTILDVARATFDDVEKRLGTYAAAVTFPKTGRGKLLVLGPIALRAEDDAEIDAKDRKTSEEVRKHRQLVDVTSVHGPVFNLVAPPPEAEETLAKNILAAPEHKRLRKALGISEPAPEIPPVPGTFRCLRRNEGPAREDGPTPDHWRQDNTCSFCGGLDPEIALAEIKAGKMVTPTDKSYKIYVEPHRDVYFQHFTDEHKDRFIALYNEKKMKLSIPGHFYVTPYFMKVIK